MDPPPKRSTNVSADVEADFEAYHGAERCPKCGHYVSEHYTDNPDRPELFKCYERLSRDNNDFCGCTHGAPEAPKLVAAAEAHGRQVFLITYFDGVSPVKATLTFRTTKEADACAKILSEARLFKR